MSKPRGNEQTIGSSLKVSLYVLMSSLGFIQGEMSQSLADETLSAFPRPGSGQRLEQTRTRANVQTSRAMIDSSNDRPLSRGGSLLSESTATTYKRVEGVGFKSRMTGAARSTSKPFPDIAVRPPKTLPESDRKPKAILESEPIDSHFTSETLTVPHEEDCRNPVDQNEFQSPRESVGIKDGPTITPLDKSRHSHAAKSWVRVEIQSVPTQIVTSQPNQRTEQSASSEIGPVSGEMSWRKSGVQQSIAISESDEPSEMTQPVASKQAEAVIPVDRVLELRKRIESAASLDPGQVLPSPRNNRPLIGHSPKVSNRSDETIDEVESSYRNKSVKELKSSITVTQPTFKLRRRRLSIDSAKTEAVEEKPESLRQPVVGKTSFIKWQPVTEHASTPSMLDQPRERSKESQPDLRQSLIAVRSSAPEPQVDSKSELQPLSKPESNTAVQSKYVRSPATYSEPNEFSDVRKSKDSAEDQVVSFVQPTETRFNGAMIDHATAPSIDGDLVASKHHQNSPDVESNSSMLAPLPPAVSDDNDDQFDHPSDLFKRNWKPRTSGPVSSSHVESTDGPGSSRPQSDSDDDDDTDGVTNIDSTLSSSSNGLSRGFAATIGVSPSTATSLLTLGSIVTIFAGLWFVRSLIRVKNS